MNKTSIDEIINDCKSKRDAVSSAHQQLKKDSDFWNQAIILLALITGGIESIKMKLKLEAPVWSLIPILLSSITAGCSAIMKFRDFNSKLETLVQSQSLITTTLNKLRAHTELDDELLLEYNLALSSLETSMYPNDRKKFLKQSHKNLIEIMKQEHKYYDLIEKVNAGVPITLSGSGSDGTVSNECVLNNSIIEPPLKESQVVIKTINGEAEIKEDV
tara:strand:+ start:10570 stop:11220 length:651 start_codon:yes stop_codon:yes gene_type:complete